jgi:choline dehydrogenase-like flavoprotein
LKYIFRKGLILLYIKDAKDFRRLLLNYPRTTNMIVLTRDYDSVGRVWIDSTGQPRIDYSLGSKDAKVIMEGIMACTRIMIAAGASEINTSQIGVPPLMIGGATSSNQDSQSAQHAPEDRDLATWEQLSRGVGISANRVGLFSAHQMGTCKMGVSPKVGAVKPDGETWEVKGLYVADASLFPTASGVNPMITTFSMAYSVAQFMKTKLNMQIQSNL